MLQKPHALTDAILRLLAENIARPITVEEWAEKWMAAFLAGKGQAQIDSVRNTITNHVLPLIGPLSLPAVRHSDVAMVLATVSDASSSLSRKVLTYMRLMFEAARRDHLIDDNPCDGLKAGGRKSAERVALTPDQQRRLERAVSGTRAETFVLLGLYTGLRREEILALTWDCVVLSDTPYLIVRQALRWEHNRPIVTGELKSEAARRTVPLPDRLVSYLRALPQDGPYLVGADQPLTASQFKNLWQVIERRTVSSSDELGTVATHSRVVRTLDFKVTPHQLRHTYITRLILGGANVKVVQYLAGHSDMKVTLGIYTHLVDHSPEKLCHEVSAAFR